jgi:hypothetical protein
MTLRRRFLRRLVRVRLAGLWRAGKRRQNATKDDRFLNFRKMSCPLAQPGKTENCALPTGELARKSCFVTFDYFSLLSITFDYFFGD